MRHIESDIKQLALDLLEVDEYFKNCNEKLTIKTFFQTWASSALGLKNLAGEDCLTTASTIVVFKKNVANVFFGGKLAYRVRTDKNGEWPPQFLIDLEEECLDSTEKAKDNYKNED